MSKHNLNNNKLLLKSNRSIRFFYIFERRLNLRIVDPNKKRERLWHIFKTIFQTFDPCEVLLFLGSEKAESGMVGSMG